jgi:hypothetical protein
MQTATVITRWVVRIAGLTQIVLGLMFWSGYALLLIPLHMLIGMVLVLGLWFLVVFASRAGLHQGLVALAFLWGLVLPVFGVTHIGLFPGEWHWVVRLVHLLLGIGALYLAERLAEHVLRRGARETARSDLIASPTRPRAIRVTHWTGSRASRMEKLDLLGSVEQTMRGADPHNGESNERDRTRAAWHDRSDVESTG